MVSPFDKFLEDGGGAVLSPESTRDVGIPVFHDFPVPSRLSVYVNDTDATTMYPKIIIGGNISKQTKRFAVIKLEDRPTKDIGMYFSEAISPEENAIPLGVKFFGLPEPEQLHQLYKEACTQG